MGALVLFIIILVCLYYWHYILYFAAYGSLSILTLFILGNYRRKNSKAINAFLHKKNIPLKHADNFLIASIYLIPLLVILPVFAIRNSTVETTQAQTPTIMTATNSAPATNLPASRFADVGNNIDDTSSGKWVGCATEEAYNSYMGAIMNHNTNQAMMFLGTSCQPITTVKYTVLEKGFSVGKIALEDGTILFVPSQMAQY